MGGAQPMMLGNDLEAYKTAILHLPDRDEWEKQDLLIPAFLLKREGDVEIYYAPHNETVNTEAQVVILGITPGWTQMKLAYQAAKAGWKAGLSDKEVCIKAKEAARFAGAMRGHLVQMLDQLGLAEGLQLISCRELFHERSELLHTTSLLRYPVFVKQQNYTGSRPNLLTTTWLREEALASVQQELRLIKNMRLIIPLGKTVERLLLILEESGHLDGRHVLKGFPHPSGANGHRRTQFDTYEEQMKHMVNALFLS